MNVRLVGILGLNQHDPGPLLFPVLENLEDSATHEIAGKAKTK